ncbi:MAG: ThiF family adenylyltransferase [Phycisphaerae bacterium]|jgi:adenylyltransferase/sulfurtransferase
MMSESTNGAAGASDAALARYSRQILFERIGEEGQRRLASARVVLIGCGALGTVLANTLVRAGVGFLRVCDRDYIERENLQRQVLFDEADIEANLPKAEAAAAKLRCINSEVTIEPVVVDVNPINIERLTEGAQVLLDGTDNFETRYLINDLAVKTSRPWVYGGAVGATGMCMTIVPEETPCLRCVFEEAPPAELTPTCDTAGILASTANLVASFQAVESIKLLVGRGGEINRHLVQIDAWSGRVVNLNVGSARTEGDCPCCGRGEYEYLRGDRTSRVATLCGRNAVQVNVGRWERVDFAAIARKLEAVADEAVSYNEFMLRAEVGGHELTLFPDGRAIFKGTDDTDEARSLYAKYLGM